MLFISEGFNEKQVGLSYSTFRQMPISPFNFFLYISFICLSVCLFYLFFYFESVQQLALAFNTFSSFWSAQQLGDVMVDVASNIMLADERVLWLAQREAKACSRIVQCLQRIATHRLAGGAHVYSTVSAILS